MVINSALSGSPADFHLLLALFLVHFPKQSRNGLIECGSLTLIVLLTMILIIGAGNVLDWLFGAWLFLILLLCFATLFFLFQRMFGALVRRSNQ